MTNPEYSGYIDDLLEAAMVKKFNQDPDIDIESYEEVRAVALEIE